MLEDIIKWFRRLLRRIERVNKINILCDREFSRISGALETESRVKLIIFYRNISLTQVIYRLKKFFCELSLQFRFYCKMWRPVLVFN